MNKKQFIAQVVECYNDQTGDYLETTPEVEDFITKLYRKDLDVDEAVECLDNWLM